MQDVAARLPQMAKGEDTSFPGMTVDWSKQLPQVHRLPKRLMWTIHLMTAVGMAFLNLLTIFAMKTLVRGKFELMQMAIDAAGLWWGASLLILASTFFAFCSLGVIFALAPDAAGSGAPENKGWLNGVDRMATIFTWRNMIVRATATIFSNASGFPVGREGPTVTMGSNLAYCITELFAYRYVRKKVILHTEAGASESAVDEEEKVEVSAWIVDQERFAAAKRVACAVGGACGMAMIFDSPIGGIIYMFEEVGSISWPPDTTFSAFGATIICNVITRFFLEQILGASLKNYVIFQVDTRLPGGLGSWSWQDVPYFVGIALFLGPFSALHTHLCLKVGSCRQRFMGRRKWKTAAKLLDGLLFAAFCASVATLAALLGGCRAQLPKDREENDLEFVRFNCPSHGDHNPVASLLVTTSEAAMKILISRKGDIFIVQDLVIAFFAYTGVNILLTGIPVPSGNFTGTMLIGGFFGRAVGVLINRVLPLPGGRSFAKPGVYAMMGSASMLCGFKQMSMAVVLFIAECGNDWNLIPPLMLCVYVSLMLNRTFSKQGFDEAQMQRKNIPFLEAEPHKSLYGHTAADLCDDYPAGAYLPPIADPLTIKRFLGKHKTMTDIPIVQEDGICMGFTTRLRVECALEALQLDADLSPRPRQPSQRSNDGPWRSWKTPSKLLTSRPLWRLRKTGGSASSQDMSFVNAELVTRLKESLLSDEGLPVQRSKSDVALLPLSKLLDPAPYIVRDRMPAPRVYALFSKVGVTCVCVTCDDGKYKGMITRPCIAEMAQLFHTLHNSDGS